MCRDAAARRRPRFDGAIAAALFGFAGHGRFYAYLDGFDPALARAQPRYGADGVAVQQAIGEGIPEFDFLRTRKPSNISGAHGTSATGAS